MNKAVVIIARNEGAWTEKTANDFRKNFPDAEIIGVDDGGLNIWPDYVRVIKNTTPQGVGRCRLIGVNTANADCIIITDGHVLFERGDIGKAWKLAQQGYIINSTTKSIATGQEHGNGRKHDPETHKATNFTAKEGDQVGLIGGVYFMRKDIALQVIAPTPGHGYNEQIMTCAAFALGHKIYCLPSMCFAHLYKKTFNYAMTYSEQQRNKLLLEWWFFGKSMPQNASKKEVDYYNFIQSNRILNPVQLADKLKSIGNE
jgi:hypothetical protein